MPQVQLPLFPAGTTHLNEDLAFECHDGQVTCFNGHLPVFTHAQDDLKAFRLYASQLVVNGSASPGDNSTTTFPDQLGRSRTQIEWTEYGSVIGVPIQRGSAPG